MYFVYVFFLIPLLSTEPSSQQSELEFPLKELEGEFPLGDLEGVACDGEKAIRTLAWNGHNGRGCGWKCSQEVTKMLTQYADEVKPQIVASVEITKINLPGYVSTDGPDRNHNDETVLSVLESFGKITKQKGFYWPKKQGKHDCNEDLQKGGVVATVELKDPELISGCPKICVAAFHIPHPDNVACNADWRKQWKDFFAEGCAEIKDKLAECTIGLGDWNIGLDGAQDYLKNAVGGEAHGAIWHNTCCLGMYKYTKPKGGDTSSPDPKQGGYGTGSFDHTVVNFKQSKVEVHKIWGFPFRDHRGDWEQVHTPVSTCISPGTPQQSQSATKEAPKDPDAGCGGGDDSCNKNNACLDDGHCDTCTNRVGYLINHDHMHGKDARCRVYKDFKDRNGECNCYTDKKETDSGPTDAPTDAGTNAPTDAGTDAPTDAGTDAPTDAGKGTGDGCGGGDRSCDHTKAYLKGRWDTCTQRVSWLINHDHMRPKDARCQVYNDFKDRKGECNCYTEEHVAESHTLADEVASSSEALYQRHDVRFLVVFVSALAAILVILRAKKYTNNSEHYQALNAEEEEL